MHAECLQCTPDFGSARMLQVRNALPPDVRNALTQDVRNARMPDVRRPRAGLKHGKSKTRILCDEC